MLDLLRLTLQEVISLLRQGKVTSETLVDGYLGENPCLMLVPPDT